MLFRSKLIWGLLNLFEIGKIPLFFKEKTSQRALMAGFCSARCVSPALAVVCVAFLCTRLCKQLWLWLHSQQNAWMVSIHIFTHKHTHTHAGPLITSTYLTLTHLLTASLCSSPHILLKKSGQTITHWLISRSLGANGTFLLFRHIGELISLDKSHSIQSDWFFFVFFLCESI